MDNLQTLCLPCHGKKDHPKKESFHKHINEAIDLRRNGLSYENIAKKYKVSIATAHKYLKGVK